MEIRWNRIFMVLMLLILTIGALKLYQNPHIVNGKFHFMSGRWHHLTGWLSNIPDKGPFLTILYMILFFEIAIIVLWLLSRVVNFFRR